MTIETPIQMRFADVDGLGHVNNVNQQHYLDVGKTDFFRRVLGLKPYFREEGVITVATRSAFLQQVRLDEPIAVRTRVQAVGTKSFTLAQDIINTDNQEIKTESQTTLVCFDFAAQHSIPIPSAWRDLLKVSDY